MPDEKQIAHHPPDDAAVRQGYEHSEVSQRSMLALLVGFVILFGGICGGLWWLHQREIRQATHGEPRSAVDVPPVTDAPPLQPQVGHDAIDAWDLKKMRDQEDGTFQQLGWQKDEKHHRFAVPDSIVDSLRQKQSAPTSGRP